MTENGNRNLIQNEQNNSMIEFEKLRFETAKISSILFEKPSIGIINLTGNELLKNINIICNSIMEKQDDQDKFNNKVQYDLKIITETNDKLTEEISRIRIEIEATERSNIEGKKTSQEILKELKLMREELRAAKQEIKTLSIGNLVDKSIDSKATSSFNSSQQISPPINIPITDKKFILKHVFKNVTRMEKNEGRFSQVEKHFSIPWKINIFRSNNHGVSISLYCAKDLGTGNWSVTTETELKMMSVKGKMLIKKYEADYGNIYGIVKSFGCGWTDKLMEWEELERKYIVDGNLTVEFHVKIKKMIHQIGKRNLFSYST